MPRNSDAGNPMLAQALVAWRACPADMNAEHDLWTACRARMMFLASRLLESAPLVHRHEATDDLVQNASLRLVEALKATPIDSDRHLLNLAAKKVREEFIDTLRRLSGPRSPVRHQATNSGRGPDGERIDLAAQAVAPEMTSATESDRWQRFHAAVGGLPEDEQEVFHMAWYVGAEQKDIAAACCCSESTVKRLWKAAKSKVKAATDDPSVR
jgi:RNA polymerase sigma factor (sigma-70 family)